MHANEYQENARRTAGTHEGLELDAADSKLLNAALGLAGEGGEVVDFMKKFLFHGHPFDRDHVVKELGDILWYVVQAADALEVTLEHIMEQNVEKLRRRYPQGFSSEASINRVE